jgi:roadblock/LC7 domain-containing protein
MIRRLLAIDGVNVVCHFRDDGALVEGHGMLDQEHLAGLAMFAHDYRRIVQSHADQLSMFSQVRGWTPPRGWIVHGKEAAVCSVGNLVCLVDSREASLTEVMRELADTQY